MREYVVMRQSVVCRSQMYAAERWVIETAGLSSLQLMEIAAWGVADAIVASGKNKPVFLCGVGNNGADGVAAARILVTRGYVPKVLILGDIHKLTFEMQHQLKCLEAFGGQVDYCLDAHDIVDFVRAGMAEADVIVDAIFGIGLSRPLHENLRQVVQLVNDSQRYVLAIDLPTGVNADTGQLMPVAVRANVCVTFQYYKYGHVTTPGRMYCGETSVVDIGIPDSCIDKQESTEVLDQSFSIDNLRERPLDAHKGTFGHLLILAGTADKPGAAYLACRAALRSGAGLVTLGSCEQTIARLAPVLCEIMGCTLGQDYIDAEKVSTIAKSHSAILIGPGLKADDRTLAVVESLSQCEAPLVLDAGALSAMGLQHHVMDSRKFDTVITPHPGEAARLLGCTAREIQSDRLNYARLLAKQLNAYVVLKGAGTLIVSPSAKSAICLKGNAGMATAGTGDVLAGMVGALLAQGVETWRACCVAVQLHAIAGDEVIKHRSQSTLIASDLLAYLK